MLRAANFCARLALRQYLSHMERKRGWPPRSQSLMDTLPLVTLRMLKPTVGIISSEKAPVANTLTSVLLPAFCRPTIVSSISCFQNRFRIHDIMSSKSFARNAI